MADGRTALEAFERTRADFVAAIDGVPAEALGFLRPGDDYAFGGLVTHVNGVLRRYGRVLDGILADPVAQLDARPIDAEMAEANAEALRGLDAASRPAAMTSLADLHAHVAAALAPLGEDDWERKTPVLFAGSDDPYPTAPVDIAGWLTGHYEEHIPHVAELTAAWRASPERRPAT